MKKITFLCMLFVCLFPVYIFAAEISEYLILQDIGRYMHDKPAMFRGRILERSVSNRFGNEAEGYYMSYQTSYSGGKGYAAPGVTVRVYDSPQWMLNELEREHKTYSDDNVAGKTDTAATTKKIGNNVVTIIRIGGRAYFWISGEKMVRIEYSDSHFQYPEPLELINEYLSKYPSTLPETYQTRKRDKEWIKEEFDRLLWVADRWVSLIKEGDPRRKEKLVDAAEHLEAFAKYRKTYSSGLFSSDMTPDIELLQNARMRADLETIVRTKLAEYKEWWAEHKTDVITFP